MSQTSAPHIKRSRSGYVPTYDLDELFDRDEIVLKLLIAEHRILKAYDYATYWSHGKLRGTDNFIVGVGPRQKDLVEHIINKVVKKGSNIVCVSELPSQISENASTLRHIARRAEHDLLADRLSYMVRNGQIWFDEQNPGTWNVSQGAMDGYRQDRELSRLVHHIEQTKRRESLHGGGHLMVVH